MYQAFYRLSAKPFQLSPDASYFFSSKGHRRAMSYLEYGLHQGEGFIVITGEIGAGKTTLVRNLFHKLEKENLVAAQLVSTQLDADDTLRMVAAAFGLAHENVGKATLLQKLEWFLASCRAQRKRVLLVVDEAQNLAPKAVEELRMLSNFQSGGQSLLQSFLLGQPEFRHTMQGEDMQQLRQRVIASYHLGPMDAEETRAYIEHRLHTAGWDGDPAFSAEAFEAIYAHTGGIPRKINVLCDRLLLMGCLEERHEIDDAAVNEVSSELNKEMALAPGYGDESAVAKELSLAYEQEVNTQLGLAKLNERMSHMEHSVTNVLKLLRDILSLPNVRRLRGEEE